MPPFPKYPRQFSLLKLRPPPPIPVSQHRCVSSATAASAARDRSSKKTLIYLLGIAGAMVGASYAAVPLYRRFCQATGYGGTVQRRESVEEKIARHNRDGTTTARELVVQFNADVADRMPWKFVPTQREVPKVRIKPGENALAFYTAENRSSTPIIGISTYNVTPMKDDLPGGCHISIYKIIGVNGKQLFTSTKYNVSASRSKGCSLVSRLTCLYFFYIDPEFETDPKMDDINDLILSYTFFKVNED